MGLQVDQKNRILHWNHPYYTSLIRKYSIYGRDNLGNQHQMETVYYENLAELSDLDPKKEYEVWMTAENLCGVSVATETVRVLTFEVPAAPQITSVQSFADSIVILFRPNEIGGPVDSFRIRYTTKNSGIQTVELPADRKQVDLTAGIENCFGHEIEVIAINRAGESAPARTTAFTKSADAPEVPTITSMVELSDGYLLSWTVNRTEGIVEYQVTYERLPGGNAEVLSVPSKTLETTLTKLEHCRNYSVRIRALGDCGISDLSEAKLLHAKPQRLPLKPANLSADGNSHQCTISWSKGAEMELRTRYELAYAKSEGYSRFYWLPPDSVQFTLKNLDVQSVYLVDLWSHNGCGWSEAANLKLFFYPNGTLIME
ncbi:uncharacterized protein DEA37_0010989 [Paragonimus westermani]|uniref:Fibronectin type-III domain-containing protein n=1 Tax=Paragonimus westermani TaxID=34504 RepID=A0A5J4NAD1_9TREM|nr:uncharacterized protein DEA37_0010989 [Paragonimus westermani]